MSLSNLWVPQLGAVDTAVMGHLPDPGYIGGVAISSVNLSFYYFHDCRWRHPGGLLPGSWNVP